MSDSKPDRTEPRHDGDEARKDREQEKALEDTFPASDPPASTGTTGPTGDRKPAG